MMSGTKQNTLDVFLGHQKKIASISIPADSESEITLVYEPSWLREGFAISPHLPLHGPIKHSAVRNFLQNLLPEGNGLEDLTSNTTISKNNTFGLIRIIGEDTAGALAFRGGNTGEKTAAKDTDFREITEPELAQRLVRFKELGESITRWDGKTRLSVAGVQDKLNLLEMNGKLGLGEGLLCSNKIFKFETGKAPCIAVNELFTLSLARYAGLNVPNTDLRTYGGVRALVVDRFDRALVSGEQRVLRRHVIDGCQAANLPPSFKYERQFGDEGDGKYIRDGVSFTKLFALKTTNTEVYRTQLMRWMTFNILVRNYDAHGKNISFFAGKQGLALTPFYDLVNIEAIIQELRVGGDTTQALSNSYAMSIGGYEPGSAGNFNDPFTAFMFADFAHEFGISQPRMQLVMSQMIQSVMNAISKAKSHALAFDLSANERAHLERCISIIEASAQKLIEEVSQISDMKDLI